MKVKAKHWINYNGKWHMGGSEFDISDNDAPEMAPYVERVEQNVPRDAQEEQPVRRGRKRKTEDAEE